MESLLQANVGGKLLVVAGCRLQDTGFRL